MPNRFLEKNKTYFELIGVMAAIGAIFLTIPTPENDKAQNALMNIQLIWLIIISVSLLLLFYKFFRFFLLVEDLAEKNGLHFYSSLAVIPFFMGGLILYHLWRYIFIIYGSNYKGSILQYLLGIVFSIYIAFTIFVSKKFIQDYLHKKIGPYLFKIFSYLLISSAVVSFLFYLLNLRFQIDRWFSSFLLTFLIAYCIVVFYSYWYIKNNPHIKKL
ncbi:MAG: hypothetical protein PHY72_02715 [Candidatus Pacebacteria bacterium]|nr:hypothetical protein [Candidatus Paceibacterota bacterium]